MSIYIKRKINDDLHFEAGLSHLCKVLYSRVNEHKLLIAELNVFGGPLALKCAEFFTQLSQTEVLKMLEIRKSIAKDAGSSKSNISNVKDKVDNIRKPSFASVVHEKPQKTIIKIKGMRNKNGPWLIRHVPLLLNEWTANTILKKDEIKRVPVWVKMHHVPIVAYFDGRSAYARVLIEIAADVKLMKSLIIAIPVGNKEGHTFAMIDIEYDWIPPRCAFCCIFDHVSEKCPKLPKVASSEKVIEEGFIKVKKKKTKTKKKSKKQVEGVRVNKPNLNLQYRRVDKAKSSKINNRVANKESTDRGPIQIMTKNSFSALSEEIDTNLKDNESLQRPLVTIRGQALPLKCFLMINVGAWNIREMNLSPKQNEVRQKPKGKDGILRKLDRVLANLEFLNVFMGVHAIFKPYRISDHSPVVLSIPSLVKVKSTPFKFFNVIILDNRFKDVVRNAWMAQISGFYMFRVVKKLKGLKKPIRKLMFDKGNMHANDKEAMTVTDFNEALLMEEKFLKQKDKITWLKEGDSNTAYFHKVVKSRVSRNRIDVGMDAYGNVHHSTEVAKAFINHYELFLAQPGNTSAFNTDNLFPTTLNGNEALNMVSDIISQEMKSAMFSMGNDKSLGPNGFTAAFFKGTWDIIGVDAIKAVKEFFTNDSLLKELNHTIIALIPKVNSPARVTHYRPISCCNVLFKCISKIIANHLKGSLKRLVSPNQLAFVPGRCISDNILLTQEIMHNYHLDRGVPWCAFKVDIQKAYDTVDWDFLRVILIGFGFHDRMIAWVMECVTTTSFSISINGSLHGHFEGKRGLRQDRLPVKYLGVPLVSSRLIARDCKELIDKVQNRVNDWKNKSLSIVGRLQLIQSVLSSMHVYWASVFMLPSCVLLDIEQIMRGFLWSQDNMSRGKVKVAWDVVCLPKQEGGLGIRRLHDHFNKALMVSHVWKLLSLKESLWVKWIHVYKLKNRSFWDIPYRDGRATSMWFDKWCVAGPLSNIISSRDIIRASFNHASKVRDCIQDGLTIWPDDWLVKYLILNSIPIPVISDDKSDALEWRCSDEYLEWCNLDAPMIAVIVGEFDQRQSPLDIAEPASQYYPSFSSARSSLLPRSLHSLPRFELLVFSQ
nr:hypothetical protein [Tanacetum cinerariifolium]